MRRIAVVVVVAGVGLSGCAGLPPEGSGGGGRAHCDGNGVCRVAISVNHCVVNTPVPDPIMVNVKGGANIQWELDFLSWLGGNTFADNGIVVKDPKGQFDQPDLSAGGRKYTLHDKNDVYGNFKYTIHVKSSVYGDCPVLDPTIVNQG